MGRTGEHDNPVSPLAWQVSTHSQIAGCPCDHPSFIDLGISVDIAGLIFLVNPIVGIISGGWIGVTSDRWRRRKPFVAVLTLCGMIGLALLIWSTELATLILALGAQGHNSQSSTSTSASTPEFIGEEREEWTVVAFCFVGYLLADVSHDLLLIPGRSLAADLAARHSRLHGLRDDAEASNTVFTLFQMLGRLALLALGSFEFAAPLRSSMCVEAPCARMQALLQVCVVVLLVCCLACLCLVEAERNLWESFVEIEIKGSDADEGRARPEETRQAFMRQESLPLVEDAVEQNGLNGRSTLGMYKTLLMSNYVLVLLMLSQIYGWIGIMCVSFYWTMWLGESSTAFLGLATAALVGLLTTFVIKRLNHRWGVGTTYFIGELSFCVCLILTRWANKGWHTVLLSGCTGFMYASHQTNVYIMAQLSLSKEVHSRNRSLIVAAIQSCMPIAQVLVGGLSGVVIRVLDNRPELLFFYAGATGLFVQSVLLIKYLTIRISTVAATLDNVHI